MPVTVSSSGNAPEIRLKPKSKSRTYSLRLLMNSTYRKRKLASYGALCFWAHDKVKCWWNCMHGQKWSDWQLAPDGTSTYSHWVLLQLVHDFYLLTADVKVVYFCISDRFRETSTSLNLSMAELNVNAHGSPKQTTARRVRTYLVARRWRLGNFSRQLTCNLNSTLSITFSVSYRWIYASCMQFFHRKATSRLWFGTL
jgi:hypothetical protein